MIQESIDRLSFIVQVAPNLLMEIGEEDMSQKPRPDKWSKKEVLGHLIDSATNNHQRFVRAQFELNPEIAYDQNNWNTFSFYQQIDSQQIIAFWTSYNKQLLEIIKHIQPDNLSRQVKVGDRLFSLEYLIVDYVKHLEHHLRQLIDY
ncbi:MAG: DinB family protein [Bacteroidia bacterium]